MNNVELGAALAHAVFEVGHMRDSQHSIFDRVQRIEFKGGTYPKKETALGGLCETALAEVLTQALNELGKEGGQ